MKTTLLAAPRVNGLFPIPFWFSLSTVGARTAMKRHIVLAVLALLAVTPRASAQSVQFIQQFGALQSANDNPPATAAQTELQTEYTYVAGAIYGSLDGQAPNGPGESLDAFVRKLDASGNRVWTIQFGTTEHDLAHAVAVDATGVYVAGNTWGALLGQTPLGYGDAFVVKYRLDGTTLEWVVQLGTTANDIAFAVTVDEEAVTVTGETGGSFAGFTNAGSSDIFVARIDRMDGTVLWRDQFGSDSSDSARAVASMGTAFFVGGMSRGVIVGENPSGCNGCAFLRRYDASSPGSWTTTWTSRGPYAGILSLATDGTDLWAGGSTFASWKGKVSRVDPTTGLGLWYRDIDGPSATFDRTTVNSIALESNAAGSIVLATGVKAGDAFVEAFDGDSGATVPGWPVTFGTQESTGTAGTGLAIAGASVLVAGWTYGELAPSVSSAQPSLDLFVRRYELSGTADWTVQFGALLEANDLAQSVDCNGNIYVGGHTFGVFPGQQVAHSQKQSGFVRKYNALGSEAWTRQIQASTTDVTALAADETGVYVTGNTDGSLPGWIKAGISTDAFVRKYDPDGNEIWTVQFGTTTRDRATGVAVNAEAIYVTGDTLGQLPGQSRFGSAGFNDGYVCRIEHDGSLGQDPFRQFGTAYDDNPGGITADEQSLYIAGYTTPDLSHTTTFQGFLERRDLAGNLLSSAAAMPDVRLRAVTLDSGALYAGGIFLGGWTARVSRFDPADLSKQWTHTGSFYLTALAARGGAVYAGGFTPNSGPKDCVVIKIMADGQEAWDLRFGSADYDRVEGISACQSGVVVVGYTYGALVGTSHQTGDTDAFVARILEDELPVARAGDDQPVHCWQPVFLNGLGSSDDNTMPEDLAYVWELLERPEGSVAAIIIPDPGLPWLAVLAPDLPGTYRVQLIVMDSAGQQSAPDELVVTSSNILPEADAGDDSATYVGNPIRLDGSNSRDADGDPLVYAWSIVSHPPGSCASLSGADSASPVFTPDCPGTFTIALAVSDGCGLGPSVDQVVVEVFATAADFVRDLALRALGVVQGLASTQVTTKGNQQALGTFLINVAKMVETGNASGARAMLEQALLRTDGCALRNTPDGTGAEMDWITDCAAQQQVYGMLTLALSAL